MDLGNIRVIFWYFFEANPMMRSLYTSADMEENISITSGPVDGFQHITSSFLGSFYKYLFMLSPQYQQPNMYKTHGVLFEE